MKIFSLSPLKKTWSAKKSEAPRFWGAALAGALLGIVLVLVYFAPAVWLSQAVLRLSGERVILAEAEGRVWAGSARLVLTGGAGTQSAVVLPGRVSWRAALAGLGLRVDMKPECCAMQPVRLLIKPGLREHTVNIQGLDLDLPASLLSGLGTPFNTLGFNGRLILRSPALSLRLQGQQWQLQGDADMRLLRLSSSLSTLPELGNYQLAVKGGPVPSVNLSTTSGALLMNGSGQWQDGRFSFNGEASAAEGYEAALANILNIIGRRDGARTRIKI